MSGSTLCILPNSRILDCVQADICTVKLIAPVTFPHCAEPQPSTALNGLEYHPSVQRGKRGILSMARKDKSGSENRLRRVFTDGALRLSSQPVHSLSFPQRLPQCI